MVGDLSSAAVVFTEQFPAQCAAAKNTATKVWGRHSWLGRVWLQSKKALNTQTGREERHFHICKQLVTSSSSYSTLPILLDSCLVLPILAPLPCCVNKLVSDSFDHGISFSISDQSIGLVT